MTIRLLYIEKRHCFFFATQNGQKPNNRQIVVGLRVGEIEHPRENQTNQKKYIIKS